jgi:hypothetical protein
VICASLRSCYVARTAIMPLRSRANDHPPEPCPRERSPKAETRRHAGPASQRHRSPRPLTLKVSRRAISVYGLGRFPITLYRGRWSGSSITTSPFKPSSPPTRPCSPRALISGIWHTTPSLLRPSSLRGGGQNLSLRGGRSMLRRSNIIFGFRAYWYKIIMLDNGYGYMR